MECDTSSVPDKPGEQEMSTQLPLKVYFCISRMTEMVAERNPCSTPPKSIDKT